jgi:hypothetical protein
MAALADIAGDGMNADRISLFIYTNNNWQVESISAVRGPRCGNEQAGSHTGRARAGGAVRGGEMIVGVAQVPEVPSARRAEHVSLP